MWNCTVTDWVQAIGVLISFPAALWAIVNLFRKDEDRQKQIDALGDMAKSQAEMIVGMREMLVESQRQTKVLSDANEIMKLQLDLQNEAFLDDKKHKSIALELAKTKHRQKIKPEIKTTSFAHSGPDLTMTFRNNGHRAIAPKIEILNEDCVKVFASSLPDKWEPDHHFYIKGSIDYENNAPKLFACQLKISYKDEDGNMYEQICTHGNKSNTKNEITLPALIATVN
jgi:hypothetical protein